MELAPGVETDSLVARLLWRAVVVYDVEAGAHHLVDPQGKAVPLPPFSTDVDTAQKVVAFLRGRGYNFISRLDTATGFFQACFSQNDGRTYRYSVGQTMAMAICCAAVAVFDGSNIDA